MSHEPRIPDANKSPYPLHSAPVAKSSSESGSAPQRERDKDGKAPLIGPRSMAIGIGSAAIVAALMFVRRR